MAFYNISTYSQYTEVLIELMLCHTTSNVPPNCSNLSFFIRLLPSLFLAFDGRRWGDPNAFGVCFEHCENGYTPRNPYIHNCNLIHKESLISTDNFSFEHEEKRKYCSLYSNYWKLNTKLILIPIETVWSLDILDWLIVWCLCHIGCISTI